MPSSEPYIVIIDGEKSSGKKTLCFELALVLLYNNKKTAVMLKSDSPLRHLLTERKKNFPALPQPVVLDEDGEIPAGEFDAVLIPDETVSEKYAENASTYITAIRYTRNSARDFQQNKTYLNKVWELKKRIAARHGRSLNWVVCENNTSSAVPLKQTGALAQISRLYGFRAAPALNFRKAYQNTTTGVSAQDKSSDGLQNRLTYEDICAKREILKLAEFIFS